MIQNLSSPPAPSSSTKKFTTSSRPRRSKSTVIEASAPITDFISSTKKKQGGLKKPTRRSTTFNGLLPASLQPQSASASASENALSDMPLKKTVRQSFVDLLKTQKDQPYDYNTMVFKGRMQAKKNAWKDMASEELVAPMPAKPQAGSLRRSSSAGSKKRRSSSKSKDRLQQDDVDKIFDLVTKMKESPDGDQLLQDLVKKQAFKQERLAPAGIPSSIQISPTA